MATTPAWRNTLSEEEISGNRRGHRPTALYIACSLWAV